MSGPGIDLRDSFRKRKEEALQVPELPPALRVQDEPADPKAPKVSRRMGFEVSARDPETGEIRTVKIVSKVPNGEGLDAIERDVARRSGGVSWALKPPNAFSRAMMLATVTVQVEDLEDWVWQRMCEDITFLTTVYGGLAEHQARYFRRERDPATGEVDPGLSGLARGPLTAL
jgi:hypothetical protein